jgi:hypothetical protein
MIHAATLRRVTRAGSLPAVLAFALGCGNSNGSPTSGGDGSVDDASVGDSSGGSGSSSGPSGTSSGPSSSGGSGGADDGGPDGSSDGGGAPSDASSGGSADSGAESGSTDATTQADGAGDGGSKGDAGADAGPKPDGSSAACVPSIPAVAWTSPYAGWSRGIPTDPAFFPIGVWLQLPSHAQELANIGVNIYIGNNAQTDPLMASDLATLKGLGMYAIVGQDSLGLANIGNTTIIGWWMDPDEPDNAQSNGDGGYGPPVAPATLVTRYSAYKAADATRPIYLGLGQGVAYPSYEGRGSNPPPESGYVPASDITAFDIYPYNNCNGDANEKVTCDEFWLNAAGIDNLHAWANRNQAAWTDFETTMIDVSATVGPTPTQTVSEVWLALIHSANGVIYFIDSWKPSFREDAIFLNSAMVSAVTALNQQIKALAPELNSGNITNLVTVTSSNASAPVDTMVKANGTSIYVFSAIARAGTATASYTINGMTGNAVATVVGESRSVNITAGKFSDAFAANAVHIYKIDLSTATCP